MKTAIVYARVSTTRQADDGVSIDAQIEICHKKAAELGAIVVRVYRDDGVTGTSALKRHAFQRAINHCTVNEIDYFIAWSTSRFARNKIDAASYKQILKESGTQLVYASMNIDSTTDEGWFTESIMEIIDEHVSRQISRDTRRAMIKNAEGGFYNGGRPPFGFKVAQDGKRRRLMPDHDEVPLILEIFRRFAGGESALSIAKSLNKSGFSMRGTEFQSASLSHMMKNPVYIGQTIYNKRTNRQLNPKEDWIIRETHDAIVPKELFDAVQERFSPRTKVAGSPSSNFLFSGLLRCGKCGKAMVIENATGRSKTYNYYNCSGFRKGATCESRRLPAEKLDKYLLGLIVDKLLTQELAIEFIEEAYKLHNEKSNERKERVRAVESELKDIRSRKESLFRVLESNPNIDGGVLLERINNYVDRENALKAELVKIEDEPLVAKPTQEEILGAVDLLKEIILNTKDVKKLRIMLQSFVQSIDFNADSLVINYIPEKVAPKTVHSLENWHAHGDSNPGCRRERAVS